MIYERLLKSIRNIKGNLPRKAMSRRRQFGEHKSAARGKGWDFYEFREYNPTKDSVDQIAWKLKPGNDRVFVREARLTRDFPLLLLADISSSMQFGGEVSPKQDLMLETVGVLGLTALHNQDRVGLIGFADTLIIKERPRGGRPNFYYLLRRLCDFLEKSAGSKERRKTDIWRVLDYTRKNFSEPCLVAVISDFIGCERVADSELLRSRHEFIFFILHDPEEFEVAGRGTLRVGNMETGDETLISLRKAGEMKAHLKERRDAFRARLRQRGVDSVVLVYGSHFRELAKFFAERR